MCSVYSFSKASRLRNKLDFKAVFDRSNRLDSACFFALVRANGMQQARLGFAVSKKNLSLACERNYFKRICKESFRYHQTSIPAVDVVIFAKKNTKQKLKKNLRTKVDALWEKLAQ